MGQVANLRRIAQSANLNKAPILIPRSLYPWLYPPIRRPITNKSGPTELFDIHADRAKPVAWNFNLLWKNSLESKSKPKRI